MKYEATIIDGRTEFIDASDMETALNKASGPVELLRQLETEYGYEWTEVYHRRYTDVIAYVNVWNDGVPVASVPISVRLESYQSIKKVKPIVKEIRRLTCIWTDAIIKVQKSFIKIDRS